MYLYMFGIIDARYNSIWLSLKYFWSLLIIYNYTQVMKLILYFYFYFFGHLYDNHNKGKSYSNHGWNLNL